VCGKISAPKFTQSIQADDIGLVEVAQAFHVEYDDFGKAGKLAAHLKGFVQLLVVLDKQNGGA
jgi:hypothetical protein